MWSKVMKRLPKERPGRKHEGRTPFPRMADPGCLEIYIRKLRENTHTEKG